MKLPNIIVVGRSGWGKSTSIRNLDPLTTAIINTENKILPFPHAGKFINQTIVSNNGEFISAWMKYNSMKEIDIIVLDSFSSRQRQIKALCSDVYKGFDIWSQHNKMIGEVLAMTKSSEKQIIVLSLEEIIDVQLPSGLTQSLRSVKMDGKEWRDTVESEFVICLFLDMKPDSKGKMQYRFITNNDGVCSAKTPMGMFSEQYIDNDLKLVVDRCKQFYNFGVKVDPK